MFEQGVSGEVTPFQKSDCVKDFGINRPPCEKSALRGPFTLRNPRFATAQLSCVEVNIIISVYYYLSVEHFSYK